TASRIGQTPRDSLFDEEDGSIGFATTEPEVIRLLVVGDEDVWPVVAIEIRTHNPESGAWFAAYSCSDADVLESHHGVFIRSGRRTEVAKQFAASSLEMGGTAEVGHAPRPSAFHLRVVVHIVGDDQVQPAVSIVVEESRRRPPQRIA